MSLSDEKHHLSLQFNSKNVCKKLLFNDLFLCNKFPDSHDWHSNLSDDIFYITENAVNGYDKLYSLTS